MNLKNISYLFCLLLLSAACRPTKYVVSEVKVKYLKQSATHIIDSNSLINGKYFILNKNSKNSKIQSIYECDFINGIMDSNVLYYNLQNKADDIIEWKMRDSSLFEKKFSYKMVSQHNFLVCLAYASYSAREETRYDSRNGNIKLKILSPLPDQRYLNTYIGYHPGTDKIKLINKTDTISYYDIDGNLEGYNTWGHNDSMRYKVIVKYSNFKKIKYP